jgi:hypothetical protein
VNLANEGPKDPREKYQLSKEDKDDLYRDYELVFSLYKTDTEIHYRRAQMMLTLQTALFAGFALKTWGGTLLSMLICIVGGVLSYFWLRYETSQRQFIELRKRMLRDIEAKIPHGINLMEVDKEVFFEKKQHKFDASRETFPDSEGEFTTSKIKTGTAKVEKRLGWTFIIVWALLLVALIMKWSCAWLPRVLSDVCASGLY